MTAFLREDTLAAIGQTLGGRQSAASSQQPANPAIPLAPQPIRGNVVNDIGKMIEAEKPGWLKQTLYNEPKRGALQAGQAYLTLAALGGADVSKMLAASEREMRSIPTSEAMELFQQSDGILETIGAAVNNPSVIPELATQSLASYGLASAPLVEAGAKGGAGLGTLAAPGAGTAIGAGVGAFGGALAGSLFLDATSTMLDEIRQSGVDLTDEAQIKKAFADPVLMKKAKASALAHGIPVAILDAISLRMAGKLKGPINKLTGGASAATRTAAHAASEPLAQGILGGGGEALGQLAQGKDFSAPDIAAEFFGEFGTTPVEIAQNLRAERVGAKGKSSQQSALSTQPEEAADANPNESTDVPPPSKLTPRDAQGNPTNPLSPFEGAIKEATPPSDIPNPPSAPPPAGDIPAWLSKWVQENPDRAKEIASGPGTRSSFRRNNFPDLTLEDDARKAAQDRIRVLLEPPTPESTGPASDATPPAPSAALQSATEGTTQASAAEIGTTPTPEAAPPLEKNQRASRPKDQIEERAREILESGEADNLEDATEQAKMEEKSPQPSAFSRQPEEKSEEPPDVSLSRAIQNRLASPRALTRDELYTLADTAYGGSRAEGSYGPSDVDDAMETAVHRYLQGKTDPTTADLNEAIGIASSLQSLANRLPTQRNRSGEKTDFQQFSTPPDYAFAVNWIANLSAADTALEPSAGTGGLLVHAQNAGAKTIANELSPRRASLLRTMNPTEVFEGDAEHIDVATQANKPTVVVMNPPFSRSGHRLEGSKDLLAGARHVMAALKAVRPGGRVVAIVGGGMNPEKATYKPFFAQLAKNFRLRANVLVDGKVYTKYGTSFDSRVLVIDKVAPVPGESPLRASASTIPELIRKLEGVRNDRPAISSQPEGADQPRRDADHQQADPGRGSAADSGSGQAADADVHSGRVAGEPMGAAVEPVPLVPRSAAMDRRTGAEPGTPGRGVQPVPGIRGGRRSEQGGIGEKSAERSENSVEPGPGGNVPTEQPELRSRPISSEPDGRAGPGTDVAPPPPPSPITPLAAIRTPGIESGTNEIAGSLNDVFTPYTPQTRFKGTKKHPAALVESVAMRSVASPPVAYAPAIDQSILDSGALSDAQLESVAIIGQANEQMLPSGHRRASMNGDGTGVGKGRIMAAVAMDNYNRGRTLSVWLTKNDQLARAVSMHYKAVGGKEKSVHLFKPRMKRPAEGLLVVSYGKLGNSSNETDPATGKPVPSNLDHILSMLGPDFDGAILFDEAHKLEGADSQGDDKGRSSAPKKDSKMGAAAIKLQDKLRDARVSYYTATAASEPGKLGWGTRLGLWGKGTAFPTFANFAAAAKESGTAFLEALALEMKMQGMYQARSIALSDGTKKGTVEVERLDVALSPRQRAVYDEAAKLWRRVLTQMKSAAEVIASGDPKAADFINSSKGQGQLFGAQQRFFSTLITSFKVPRLIEEIGKDLARGESAVIQLTRTFGSATDKALAERDESVPLEELDISPVEQLTDLLLRVFPVHRVESYMNEHGKQAYRLVEGKNKAPVVDPEALAMRDALIADLKKMKILPRSPIDQIIDHFGVDQVAEITGRARRTVKDQHGKMIEQSRGAAPRRADQKAFADAKKRVLVFSAAGGTGADYHAGLELANQQHRNHYLLDPGWKSTDAIQGLGRTHRTNQASAPTWKLLATDIPGEKRFISTIARRLEQMGAITRGTRKGAATGVFRASDNMESPIARDAAATFLRKAADDKLTSAKLETIENELGLKLKNKDGGTVEKLPSVEQLLNRMLMLGLDNQEQVYSELARMIEDRTEAARVAGRLDTGIEEFKAESIVEKSQNIVFTDKSSGASSTLVTFETRERVEKFDWKALSAALASLPEGKGNAVRFVREKANGKLSAIVEAASPRYDAETGAVHPRFRAYSQQAGRLDYIDVAEVTNEKYETLEKGRAIDAWNEAVAALPEFKSGKLHLVKGLLLPLWKELGANVKILRVTSDDGQVHLGRRLSSRERDRFLKARGLEDASAPRTSRDIAEKVLSGTVVKLQNGLALERRKVGGETRLEITGLGRFDEKAVGSFGAFNEKVGGFGSRWFLPIKEGKPTDATMQALDQLLRYAPVSAFESEEESDTYMPQGSPIQQGARGRPVSTSPSAAPRKLTAEWIVAWMSDRFDVPMRYGRVTIAGAAGIYKAKSEVIRLRGRFWGNLYVHAHEVAHHIDKSGLFTGGVRGGKKGPAQLPADMLSELGRLDFDKAKGRPKEGFAEFIARSFVNHEDLSQVAPLFSDHFYGTLLPAHPRLAADLFELRAHVKNYQSQTALERVRGKIKDDGRPERIRPETRMGRFKEDLRALGSSLYYHLSEQGAAVEEFQKQARAAGDDPEKDLGAYDVYRQVRRASLKWGFDAFDSGAFTLDEPGNIMGPSIGDVFKLIEGGHEPETLSDFISYAVSAHAIEMEEKGVASGLDLDDAQAVVDQLGGREDFKQAHAALSMMNDVLLDVLLQQKVTSPKQVEAMRAKWGDLYLPMLRVKQLDGATKKAFGGDASILKARHGSGAPIINPIAATMWKYLSAYRLAGIAQLKNSIIDAALRAGERGIGMGQLVEPYPHKMKVVRFDPAEVRQQLEAAGLDPAAFDEVDPEAVLSIIRPDLYADRSLPNIWQRYEGEELKQYRIDPALADAVAQLTRTTDAGVILRAAAVLTRAVATGATVFNPNFLLRNTLARDPGTYLLQGEGTLLDRITAIPIEYYKSVKHFSGKERDPMRALFDRMHASTTAIDLGYQPGAKEIAQSVRPGSGLAKGVILNPTRALLRAGEIGESNPRMAAFNAVLTKAGYPREIQASGKNPPLIPLLKAINTAADATTDFSRRGAIADQMRIFLFSNPIVQSTVRGFRNITNPEYRKKNLPYIAGATIATIVYWLAVKDADWWKEKDEGLKYTHVLANSDFRWALPQEFAHFVFGPVLSLLDGLYQKDKTVGDQLAKQLYRSVTNQIPSVPSVQGALEVAMNYDTFREKPIENAAMQNLKPIDRVEPSTTNTARLLAHLFLPLPRGAQLSPVQVEHLLNSYTGGAFRTWVRPIDKVLGGQGLSSRDFPGIQGFTLHGEHAASPGRFYDELDSAREAVGSLKNKGVETGPAHDRLHELERYADIMGAIRKKTQTISNKEDRFKFDRYSIGLARRALGLPELDRYPDPIKNPPAEPVVREAVEASLARDVIQATDAPPTRGKLEPLAKYQARTAQWKKERDRSAILLKDAGYSKQDLVRMLLQKAKSSAWNTKLTDEHGKITPYGNRLRRLHNIGNDARQQNH